LFENLITLGTPHAKEVGCYDALLGFRDTLERGTSSERQVDIYDKAIEGGDAEDAALKKVVAPLVSEFDQDL